MARGRFLSRSVSLSEQIDDLIDREGFEAGLLITWMIPHLDVDGRMRGGPKAVKATVCPLRDDVTREKVASILEAADDIGLLRWYEVDGERFVWFPKFDEHQQGLRRDREASSNLPEWLPEYSRSAPGGQPSKVSKDKSRSREAKQREDNDLSVSLREPNRSADIRSVFEHYRTHHPRAARNPQPRSKEWRNIAARLAEGFTVDDLRRAIDGCHKTPHNLGDNDRGQKYLGLELITRSHSQVTRFIENDESPPRPMTDGERMTQRLLTTPMPPPREGKGFFDD
jgi:hypothetical protein